MAELCGDYAFPADPASHFPEMRNTLLLSAARCQSTSRPPVWVMRQAGRYLPEFRKLRESHDFFEICRTPELAAEITLQPIDRYPELDASIIFSDILVVPQALGMQVDMLPAHGPHFPRPLRQPEDGEKLLKETDELNVDAELRYVYAAITLTRQKLEGRVPLIGFCGSPWTLFAYMIEGGGSKTLQQAHTWINRYPELSHRLLERIADTCAQFLVGQIRAGAQMVQIFDSWAGELEAGKYRAFSLQYCYQISRTVRQLLEHHQISCPPISLFPKGGGPIALESIAQGSQADTHFDVIGLDWTIDAEHARRALEEGAKLNRAGWRGQIALQGNMNPNMLYAGQEAISRDVERMAADFRPSRPGWIANLGHGITPGVDPEDMKHFLQCVQAIRPA
ncbi:uncharacterized protein L969DRAFT_100485 [Mixia osmundae IAM 14324]|uniref:Uroporphyrinogen decarboxylase n=1 Tax=Mixia osmundae (strain CBS 9802 / IAM 14324 / JCM 22182 / KY 12970) TaxID=764103 RepID=G7E3T7_MIXOS|nr:uncharacterized protein L969DRAFT_100485 [Mixia osmundae IAM 14324]KEI41942.1 hypothetical protein L969DRAFT_100485 [Mixia osmundae IAM 14324]GAA97497.1 hypothetical protein E5Q_04175 [Mixia osmundae IAM 14324]